MLSGASLYLLLLCTYVPSSQLNCKWGQGRIIHFFEKCPDQWLDKEMSDGSCFPTPMKLLGSLHATVYWTLGRIFQAACFLDFYPHWSPPFKFFSGFLLLLWKKIATFSSKPFSGFSSHLKMKHKLLVVATKLCRSGLALSLRCCPYHSPSYSSH